MAGKATAAFFFFIIVKRPTELVGIYALAFNSLLYQAQLESIWSWEQRTIFKMEQ